MRISGTTATEIADSVRNLIASGELAPQALLPPVRTLAPELGVNRNTVAAAYRQLVAAGVAETRGRGGTFVAGVPRLAREGAGFGGRLIDLASGNPDPELLPDVLAAVQHGEYRQPLYGTPAVDPALAEWAAARYAEDLTGSSFRVLVTNGAVDATERLLNAHLTRGDAVAIEDPCFLASIGTLRVNGYRTEPVAVDHAGMRPQSLRAALERGARAVVCTPRAHNPTGASLTVERAAELRAILADHPQVLVIEDDHFSAVSAMPYHRITPPGTTHWALVRSVSKFLGPDLRLALVATDEGTARRLEVRLSPGTMWVSRLLQHAARELLLDPEVQELHTRARTAYAQRSASLVKEINARGIGTPAGYRPDGLNVWIDLGSDAREVVDALARRGWAVRPGDLFAAGRAERPALRVTTATLTEPQAREFAADLAAVLDHPQAT
ncbi:aminotransferase class I/II-fold pyridoxal phosphate-dependent enzyme [Microbispora sp. KK1-11]|uniref:aminotransferase class I/II-fold pyridoxal phosphate-dependent enzyme n=1 Tax=Microbispora sp. KK1-11 TaxID=2053005 RepID=UPI001157906C|nr:aminotransferase class I/II-fold pyridoxal phosphate-dependent enzyme [Microbispora sp. KK1-11]TQS22517.1 aminotransferase class I/II-fold pyridoxal phosphate-dependent enzyme [Microbispora sp. KK1-11]